MKDVADCIGRQGSLDGDGKCIGYQFNHHNAGSSVVPLCGHCCRCLPLCALFPTGVPLLLLSWLFVAALLCAFDIDEGGRWKALETGRAAFRPPVCLTLVEPDSCCA